jgi:hypothetical protein
MSGAAGRRQLLLSLYLVAFFAALIGVPVWHRGPFVYGWELVGPAEGYRLLNEEGFVAALRTTWERSRHYFYWTPIASVPFALVPALLRSMHPWPFWPQAVSFAVTLGSVLLCASILRLRRALLLAVLGAAPALAMFAVVGFPYSSILLPFSLALILVFRRRGAPATPASLALELLLWLGVAELTLHCYEMSKIVFLVLLSAAIALAGVPRSRRALWAVGALAFAVGAFRLGGGNLGQIKGTAPFALLVAAAPSRLLLAGRDLLTDWAYSSLVVLPLALAALVCVERDACFWRVLWFGTLVPVLALALQGPDQVRTRRLLLLLFCSALLVVLAWDGLTRTPARRAAVVGLMAAGHLMALATVARFVARPIAAHALPWTASPADFVLDPGLLRDAQRLIELVRKGQAPHVLVYGYGAYPENTTDPQALPERLLLGLGYETFSRRVFLLDRPRCRYSCLASFPEEALPAIAMAGPFYVHIYRDRETAFTEDLLLGSSERQPLNGQLQRFTTVLVTRYVSPVLELPRAEDILTAGPGRPGLCLGLLPKRRAVELLADAADGPKGAATVVGPEDRFAPAEPTSARVWADVDNPSAGPLDAELEAAIHDELAVRVNGRVVLASFGEKPTTTARVALRLAPGRNHLEGVYTNLVGRGFLRLVVRDRAGRPLAMRWR